MNFKDVFFDRNERYSIGVEVDSGKYYVSIPVTNGPVDYEEYYEINEFEYSLFISTPLEAVNFAKKCKKRESDSRLMIQPGTRRGVAT